MAFRILPSLHLSAFLTWFLLVHCFCFFVNNPIFSVGSRVPNDGILMIQEACPQSVQYHLQFAVIKERV